MTRRLDLPPRPWAARLALCLATLAPSCSALPPPPPPAPPPPARLEAAPLLRPARYLITARQTIEQTDDGIERLVLNGRRFELKGAEIARVGPAEPELDGGARAPSWAAGPEARYLFWKGRQLWGAETFLGPLHPLAPLPLEPHGSFNWLDGTGLWIQGGAVVARAAGDAPRPTGVPGLARAVAADARRALAVTALGHAWLTLDGGASYRDVSADLGGVTDLEMRGDAIAATLSDGRERLVTAAGAIVDAGAGAAGTPGSRPPKIDPDPFRDATHVRPLDAAVRNGLPLADGGVVITGSGFVGRFDPATLHSTSAAPLDPGLRHAECTPVRADGDVLLACVGADHAAVVDVGGTPRTERTFDLAGASELDRFVSTDDALGFLGPCDGAPPRAPETDLATARGEPLIGARQKTPVFCVRARRDEWVEHHLEPGEVEELMAWIPRASGGAVALLGRPGSLLDDRARVRVRGALRVVRVALAEPPLGLAPVSYDRAEHVRRNLSALPDDTLVGWLSPNGNGWSTVAVAIDAGGHVRARATPRASHIVHAGPLALAAGDDARLWETVDTGLHWMEVEPPPLGQRSSRGRPSSCSPAGCFIGGIARLGWTGLPAHGSPPEPTELPFSQRPPRDRYHRPPPPPALVRLACAPAGAPEGRRVADSGGFGYTPQAQPRSGLTRIGALGVANIPWTNGPHMPSSGDIEVAWMAPLDVTGTIHRMTIPISRLGLASGATRAYELRIGYLLAPDGGLETFATGYNDQCFSNLLEVAGITRPLGACADEPSVGVDLGDRILMIQPGWSALRVLAAQAQPRAPAGGLRGKRPAASAAFTIPVALHEIHSMSGGGTLRGSLFGVGARGGAPVVIIVDAGGDAALAPIDPERGTVGAEERLRPLTEAILGSAPACAPRAGDGAARVVLPFEGTIGIDRAALPGVQAGSGAGVAVLRWSKERVCLDAVEIPVRDDRFDESPGPYEPAGTVRKIVARFDGRGQATLVLVGQGTEVRQRLVCKGLSAGSGEAP